VEKETRKHNTVLTFKLAQSYLLGAVSVAVALCTLTTLCRK